MGFAPGLFCKRRRHSKLPAPPTCAPPPIKARAGARERHSRAQGVTMPASPFIMDRHISIPAGFQLLGAPPHLLGMAGLPVPFPGYSFIPYPPHASSASYHQHHQQLLGRSGHFLSPFRVDVDPSRVSKAATRESTSALKGWLSEHLKNPYPTKGEKIMLAIVTKMSLTQVSTWFANARRRLKKENRVSWASKGKSDEEEEESEEEEEEGPLKVEEEEEEIDPQTVEEPTPDAHQPDTPGVKVSADKPKIWSLAETATSAVERKSPSWWCGWPARDSFSPVNLSTRASLSS